MIFRMGVIAVAVFLSGCGTFSVVRPADTLKSGQFEASGGLTANHLGEFLFVGKGDFGITDWLEVGAHYEVYSYLIGLRAGLLHTDDHGFALALGLQTGRTLRLLKVIFSSNDTSSEGAFTVAPSLTLGRRWDQFEPYLGMKVFLFPSHMDIGGADFDYIFSGKIGFRFYPSEKIFLFFEGGPSIHKIFLGEQATLAEGALGGGLQL